MTYQSYTFLILLSVLVVEKGEAAWHQNYCASSDGSVKLASGDNDNFIKVSLYNWNNDKPIIQEIELELDKHEVIVESTKDLKNEIKNICPTHSDFSFTTWVNVKYQEIIIKKKDQGLFPKEVMGSTMDQTEVRVRVLCEENGSSEMPCR